MSRVESLEKSTWVMSRVESVFEKSAWVMSRVESVFEKSAWVMSRVESLPQKSAWIASWLESTFEKPLEPWADSTPLCENPTWVGSAQNGVEYKSAGLHVDPDEFVTPATARTNRGHPWKLFKPHAMSRARRQVIGVRAINNWNSLPPTVVQASSLNMFKARLDRHWANIMYQIPTHEWVLISHHYRARWERELQASAYQNSRKCKVR